ncbi:hypothetical protein ACFLZM_04750 [Thermodesulfobacteriota bacterium]
MKTLIGGAAATVLGIIGLTAWWSAFLLLLKGAIPITLLAGGALAIYLGFDEIKDSWKKEEPVVDSSFDSNETDKYKKEIDELKKEVENLKSEKEKE